MNKNQKGAVSFAILGAAFIAGGIGFNQFFEYSLLIGWGCGLISKLVALGFAMKWNIEK
ncbi:hypothetical protein [Halobacillus sp. Marseille-P3879]|uniref:hypothetical protein n=1 Tax=Halobacillus sp. Marseille-P3879 TaxID=2045014 RepID=UPI0013576A0E|nr:hypothetical protein [Halobacillus sp. Marseille-P3879]